MGNLDFNATCHDHSGSDDQVLADQGTRKTDDPGQALHRQVEIQMIE